LTVHQRRDYQQVESCRAEKPPAWQKAIYFRFRAIALAEAAEFFLNEQSPEPGRSGLAAGALFVITPETFRCDYLVVLRNIIKTIIPAIATVAIIRAIGVPVVAQVAIAVPTVIPVAVSIVSITVSSVRVSFIVVPVIIVAACC
jgi:hypothetical protein